VSAPTPFDPGPDVRAFCDQRAIVLRPCDALGIAARAGAPRAHNVVLLGFAAGLDAARLDAGVVRQALLDVSPTASREVNARLFDAGRGVASPAQEVRTDA